MRLSGILCCASMCCLLQGARSLNIIALATVATRSHFLWTDTLLSELLGRGHQITEFTFKQPALHPNRTVFVLERGTFPDEITMSLIDSTKNDHFLTGIYEFFKLSADLYQSNMASDAFKRLKEHLLKKKEKVDLILIDYAHREPLIGVSQLVDYPPIMAITAYNHPTAINRVMRSPQVAALIPIENAPYSCEMTFHARALNFIGYSFSQLIEIFDFEPKMNQLLRKAVSPDSPSLAELEMNISMALVNTHPTTHCQQATTASVVEVGFLHVKPPKSLPKDIQKFLDGADDGVIVVSFGSMIRPDLFAGLQDMLVEVFRTSRQRFLWKTPNPPKNLPPNVLSSKWLPQSDVLAHPNVRLIITHGGTLSMQEAVYRGVPLLMIPFFLDQQGNANRMVGRGVGRTLNRNQLTVETLSQEIKAMLENTTYKEKMRLLSTIAQDEPETALQRAVFWVEFFGRHKGAVHLKTEGQRMTWIQYYCIDVITLLFFVAVIVCTTSTLCARCLIRRMFGSKRKAKNE